MANYALLVTEWTTLTGSATVTTPPQAATVPGFLQQLEAVTVTGVTPTLAYSTGAQIFNCIVWSEFEAITAAQQTLLLQVCTIQGAILGGSASPFVSPFFGTLASKMPTTITNLVALSQALVVPWWQSNGFLAPININDLIAAGIITQTFAHSQGLV